MPENYLAMGLLAGIFAAGFLAGYGIRSWKSLLHRRSVLERVRVYHQAASGEQPPCDGKRTAKPARPSPAVVGARVVAGTDTVRHKAS